MLATKQLVIREIIDIHLPIIPFGVQKAVCPWLRSVVESRLVKPRFTGGRKKLAGMDGSDKVAWRIYVEEVGEFLRPKEAEGVPGLYRQAVGTDQESTTPLNNRELHSFKMVETVGIEPATLRDRVLHLRC